MLVDVSQSSYFFNKLFSKIVLHNNARQADSAAVVCYSFFKYSSTAKYNSSLLLYWCPSKAIPLA